MAEDERSSPKLMALDQSTSSKRLKIDDLKDLKWTVCQNGRSAKVNSLRKWKVPKIKKLTIIKAENGRFFGVKVNVQSKFHTVLLLLAVHFDS